MAKAKKTSLVLTLVMLQALSIPVLISVYQEAGGKDELPADITQPVLLEKILEIAEPAPEPVKEPVTPTNDGFPIGKYKGKKYQALMPKANIPGIGIRTAAELVVDDKALEYLIKNECVGTVIAEV